ncbi:glycoside hydrolase family 32 protein [Desertihabitans aurantiacus]|uniref:glycoside hydrolase family 32 protein n=1 Tax=Desertihabitans aurantiacus TaxID=2282477 RepID=UPI000DF8201A|nr:glycoside hydrolase family 32 protein [Desertihabitans aurantiacus]
MTASPTTTDVPAGTARLRPAWHVRPEQGWLNDPNGLARVDGRYHVFFQHHPTSTQHREIHWGHASSADLITWADEPIALTPRPGGIDAIGCWTGCLVVDDGVPTLVYSAVSVGDGSADVVLARGDAELRHFVADEHATAPMPRLEGVTDVRDPFVFTAAGRRWGVQGAGSPGGRPQLLLWQCDDLTEWQPRGVLVDDTDPVLGDVAAANIWECPNLVPVGDRWLLVLSLWRRVEQGRELHGVRWAVGDLRPEGDGLRFVAERGGVVDDGPTFYAPQLLLDADADRVLMWGWAWERDRTAEQVAEQGWQGVLTSPRELGVEDGVLVQRPAAELERLWAGTLEPAEVAGAHTFAVEADGPGALRLGGEEVAVWDAGARVLVDGSLVEVFSADGRTTTTRGYPTAEGGWEVVGEGRLHRLRPPTAG